MHSSTIFRGDPLFLELRGNVYSSVDFIPLIRLLVKYTKRRTGIRYASLLYGSV